MKLRSVVAVLMSGIILTIVCCKPLKFNNAPEKFESRDNSRVPFDDTTERTWADNFRLIGIQSTADGAIQKAYFFEAESNVARPLVVSLHTWSGSYAQEDLIAGLSRRTNVHYIHPDFRGPNNTINACCSDLAMQDIDDAISWAIAHANVDTSRIYVIGVSGGGYATLNSFMRSRHAVRKFSAWASITDLVAWYHESRDRNSKYAAHILQCTGSDTIELDVEAARGRSPYYRAAPVSKLRNAELYMYAGVSDGLTGSVPITHTIRFYNKLLGDLGVRDSAQYVSGAERLALLHTRAPLGNFGEIGGRRICLQKGYGNIKLVIFEGSHEMLTEYAFGELMGQP